MMHDYRFIYPEQYKVDIPAAASCNIKMLPLYVWTSNYCVTVAYK